ncbi:MAG: TonB-dependent receptor [Candidatus Omnitrophica bacterium]|nr:TonB-dependent receptor [Candidatus Omnitrophota bacterium]
MKKKSVANLIFFSLWFLIGFNVSAQAQEAIDLEDIIVTPYAAMGETKISATPYAAKVYTQDDIKKTGSVNTLDFLKKSSTVNVSDYYGTGLIATVDMMGFGDNATSNVLVLVNGRRVNNIDMSGIDWTQLPLENIERIEIIKGGGAILYGDNASGGVINIISKKELPNKLNSEINFEAGSYRHTKESLAASGGSDKLNFYTFSEYQSTDGYRQNSHYRSEYSSLKLNSQPRENIDIALDFGHHKYVYGLPAGLTEVNLASGYSRRDSTTPLDNVQREENTLGFNIKNKISTDLTIGLDMFYRNRNELEEMFSWFSTTDKKLSNIQIKPQLLFSFDTNSLTHDTIIGFEFYACDLSADGATSTTDIDRRTLAWFIQDNIVVNEDFNIHLGARLQKEKFTFDYVGATSTDEGLSFTEELYELGINYKIADKTNVYCNLARGLRVGKTDEYLVTWPTASVNTALKPQQSKTATLGLNSQLTEKISTSLDYFFMSISDEIYYDPGSWTNGNYDKIQRQGINASLNFDPVDCLNFNVGYRFIDSEFSSGNYNGKKVPFVPKSIFTVSVKYDFLNNFSLFVDYMYRGKVYLINDLNNISPKLKSYNVTNMKVNYAKNNFEIFCGIKNLFNEIYSEYAATNIGGTSRMLYPSPERNYFGGVKIKF